MEQIFLEVISCKSQLGLLVLNAQFKMFLRICALYTQQAYRKREKSRDDPSRRIYSTTQMTAWMQY